MTIEYGQDLVDVLDDNNAERMRARLTAARRRDSHPDLRAVRQEESGGRTLAGKSPRHLAPSVRSLPSGPAPNWTGFVLALAFLFVACMGLFVVLGVWAIAAPLRWLRNLLERIGE